MEKEITQKELADLENREIAADLGEQEKIVQLQEEKKRQGIFEFFDLRRWRKKLEKGTLNDLSSTSRKPKKG